MFYLLAGRLMSCRRVKRQILHWKSVCDVIHGERTVEFTIQILPRLIHCLVRWSLILGFLVAKTLGKNNVLVFDSFLCGG